MMNFLHAKNYFQSTGFTYINWLELIEKVENPVKQGNLKVETAKEKSAVIGAHDAKNKQKETVLQHDNFTLLRLDLDASRMNIEEISALLNDNAIESYIIHTTARHKSDPISALNHYRVYIELAESLVFDAWATVESYLSFIFQADDCATRPQQIMYLPFKSDHYEYHIGTGNALSIANNMLLVKAQAFKDEQDKEKQALLSKSLIIKQTYKPTLIRDQISIIDLVNESYEWNDLLSSFGYKQQGNAWLPPETSSNKAGAYLLTSHTDGKVRYYSHHTSDPCAIKKCIDKFDFICIRKFANNATRTLNEIAKMHFPDEHIHNQREFKKEKNNQRLEALRALFAEGGA